MIRFLSAPGFRQIQLLGKMYGDYLDRVVLQKDKVEMPVCACNFINGNKAKTNNDQVFGDIDGYHAFFRENVLIIG